MPLSGGCSRRTRFHRAILFAVTALLLPAPQGAGASTPDPAALEPARPERTVSGQVLTAAGKPPLSITVADGFRYAGAQRFILRESADVEQHFFVDAGPSGTIRRAYWLQFERMLAGHEGEYAYDKDTPVEISGRRWGSSVRRFKDPPAPDSDRHRAWSFLRGKGYAMPEALLRARLTFVEADRRHEVMIVYLEPSSGEGEVTSSESEGILKRARDGLTIQQEAAGAGP